MASERGQSTVEWIALVLLVALVLGGLLLVGPHVDGRSYGGFLARSILCAMRGGCDDARSALERAYGPHDSALVRKYAPSIVYEPGEKEIPIDYRRCRSTKCGNAPTDRSLDVSQTSAGLPATAFTHVLHRDGSTYIQYWLYYTDSNTTWAGSDKVWSVATSPLKLGHKLWGKIPKAPRYVGFHNDDWEGYQVRIDPDGTASVRATAHKGYQWCKQRQCHNRWGDWTGWTRVSRGSHAGHIPLRTSLRGVRLQGSLPFVSGGNYKVKGPAYPGVDIDERTTVSADLTLVPLESVDQSAAPEFDSIKPPWTKPVYRDPLSNAT
jgi:hypothetical protein